MKYPGEELDNFDRATIWRKYIYFEIKKFIKGNILEVGAGIGSFTKNYIDKAEKLTLSEIDLNNYEIISKKFKNNKIKITNKVTEKLNDTYNTIMYLNVLEHIENDKDEINKAINKLQTHGHLVVLVPAHDKLFSKFDKAVGHFRRYEKDFFLNLNLKNCKIEKLVYLDALGYLLYYLNKIFFKEEVYPSKIKILIWDKIFTPITFFLDKILLNKLGKNILYVIKKL